MNMNIFDDDFGTCPRCTDTDKEDDLHPEQLCPYDMDINNSEYLCTCCPDHRGDCADDV